MKFLHLLANLDRRIIFAFIAAAVLVPVIVPLGFPPPNVTRSARAIYDEVEKLPPGSPVLVSFDYDPAAAPECHPMAIAFLHHCFARKLHVITMALWPLGDQLAIRALAEVTPEYDVRYGVDYVNLGYKPAGPLVIKTLGASFADAYPTDKSGRTLSELRLMSNVKSLRDVSFVMDLSAGDPGIPAWVAIANAMYQRKLGGGTTAVSAPGFTPYVQAGQMVGLLGGMRGAAEYERLVNHPARGSRGMDAQSIAHLVIILFIVFANISYFAHRRAEKKGGAAAPGAARPPAA
jgi:hypothetical protein